VGNDSPPGPGKRLNLFRKVIETDASGWWRFIRTLGAVLLVGAVGGLGVTATSAPAIAAATPLLQSATAEPAVLPVAEIHLLLWKVEGKEYPKGYVEYVEGLLRGIAEPPATNEANVFTVMQQYWGGKHGGEGSNVNISRPFFVGKIEDEEKSGDGCTYLYANTEPCVETGEITGQVEKFRQGATAASPLVHELWVVTTPPGVAICEESGKEATDCGGAESNVICGYHEPETFLNPEVSIAIVPFARGNCIFPGQQHPEEPTGSPGADSEAATLMSIEHELAEAITDY